MENATLEDNWWNDLTEDEFQNIFRMSRQTLERLQTEIDRSEDLHEERIDNTLLACLWFLGSTKPITEAETLFGIKHNVADVIRQYLLKILHLGFIYIAWPSLPESVNIEREFASEYHFPTIIGVIGSLHIEINASDLSDAELYYNEMMEKHSIILQVVCDSKYLLRDVCVGCPGGKSVAQIFETSPLYKSVTNTEGVLQTKKFHLLGGTELPSLNHLLTPYKLTLEEQFTDQQYQFNVRHESAMAIVEKSFRYLENRFPRLRTVERPESSSLIISCICILHNFTRIRYDSLERYT